MPHPGRVERGLQTTLPCTRARRPSVHHRVPIPRLGCLSIHRARQGLYRAATALDRALSIGHRRLGNRQADLVGPVLPSLNPLPLSNRLTLVSLLYLKPTPTLVRAAQSWRRLGLSYYFSFSSSRSLALSPPLLLTSILFFLSLALSSSFSPLILLHEACLCLNPHLAPPPASSPMA